MCPAVLPRVKPTMVPRAYWSQWGAPSPAKGRHEVDTAVVRFALRELSPRLPSCG